MSIIKRVTHPASLSFVNLILALGSVPTVALSSSTRKSRIMIPVGICSCQCTIIPERVFNLGGITDQFARNKCSTSPVSLSTKNGIFKCCCFAGQRGHIQSFSELCDDGHRNITLIGNNRIDSILPRISFDLVNSKNIRSKKMIRLFPYTRVFYEIQKENLMSHFFAFLYQR